MVYICVYTQCISSIWLGLRAAGLCGLKKKVVSICSVAASVCPRSTADGVSDKMGDTELLSNTDDKIRPHTATQAQAAALQKQGDYVGAERLYRELADQHLATLGAADPATLQCQYNLAVLCEHLGEYTEAERLYRTVQVAQAASLGENHEATLRTCMGLVNVLAEADRRAEAEELCRGVEQAQTQRLGGTHRDTLRSRLNLACLMADSGRLEEGQQLCRVVEATQTEALGPEDPDTLLTRYNLATMLHEAARAALTDAERAGTPSTARRALVDGRRDSARDRMAALDAEAEAMVKQVAAAQAEALGPSHPATLKTQRVGVAPLLAAKGDLHGSRDVLAAGLVSMDTSGSPPPVRARMEFVMKLAELDATLAGGTSPGAAERQADELFDKLATFDLNGNGYIDAAELRNYLEQLGLWGSESAYSDEEWPHAFPALCEMLGAPDPATGLDMEAFSQFHCWYLTNHESLLPPGWQEERKTLFNKLAAVDDDGNGYIDAAELRNYLEQLGLWGSESAYSDEEWPLAFPALCAMLGAQPEKGLDHEAFSRFHGHYLTNPEALLDVVTLAHEGFAGLAGRLFGDAEPEPEPDAQPEMPPEPEPELPALELLARAPPTPDATPPPTPTAPPPFDMETLPKLPNKLVPAPPPTPEAVVPLAPRPLTPPPTSLLLFPSSAAVELVLSVARARAKGMDDKRRHAAALEGHNPVENLSRSLTESMYGEAVDELLTLPKPPTPPPPKPDPLSPSRFALAGGLQSEALLLGPPPPPQLQLGAANEPVRPAGVRTVAEAEAAEEAFFSRSRSLYATQPDKSALALADRALPADAPAGREDADMGPEWQDADDEILRLTGTLAELDSEPAPASTPAPAPAPAVGSLPAVVPHGMAAAEVAAGVRGLLVDRLHGKSWAAMFGANSPELIQQALLDAVAEQRRNRTISSNV
jgi:Ca2+-binding EF-hand superfamily protein